MVTLTDIAALINFDYTDESRAEVYPIDNDSSLILFANIEESTNILLEFDTT
ncbi:hypothetical protein KAR91_35480 [Candidatus Pacearchaeota archaeon]|nr:hypothetical protein [Candidatus Pacearchaeota archaeon]